MATNVWATITPAGRERQAEAEPVVEVLAEQAAAPEARRTGRRRRRPGGSTIDSVHRARTKPRPGNPTRASSQASGTPKHDRERGRPQRAPIDSHSAVRTLGSLSTPSTCSTAPATAARGTAGRRTRWRRRPGRAPATGGARSPRAGGAAPARSDRPSAHGAGKPYLARIFWPCVAEHEVDERLRRRRVRRLPW